MEAPDELVGPHAAVADHDAGQIDGEEAAAVHQLRAAEHRQPGRQGKHRVEAAGEVDAVDDVRKEVPAGEAAGDPEAHLRHEVLHGEPGETAGALADQRSEEQTSELKSLMRTSYAVFCLKK